MSPDFDIRLISMIKAMEEVVVPAIPEERSLAREQAGVLIGHLQVFRDQWPHVAKYAWLCLRDSQALARDLIETLRRFPETPQFTALRNLLAKEDLDAASSATTVWACRNALASSIDIVIDSTINYGTEVTGLIDALVLSHAAREHRRDRVWFQGTALDPDVASLPSIEEMLSDRP